VGLDDLRKPFLVAALAAVALALLTCLGSGLLVSTPSFGERVSGTLQNPAVVSLLDTFDVDPDDARDSLDATRPQDPPGLGIPALALTEGLLLLVLVITAAPLLFGERATGTVTGVVSVVGGIVLLFASIATAIIAFTALLLMVGLFLAAPFGTIAYLALFGSFDTGPAAALTSLVLALTLGCLVLLGVAQQRFWTMKGLLLLLATTALLTFVTALLHGLVPGFLASITDALAALVTAVVTAVWALLTLIWGIVGAARVLQVGRQGGAGRLTRPDVGEGAARERPDQR